MMVHSRHPLGDERRREAEALEQQRQGARWHGHGALPDTALEAQVRREVNEWQTSLYSENRWSVRELRGNCANAWS